MHTIFYLKLLGPDTFQNSDLFFDVAITYLAYNLELTGTKTQVFKGPSSVPTQSSIFEYWRTH